MTDIIFQLTILLLAVVAMSCLAICCALVGVVIEQRPPKRKPQ